MATVLRVHVSLWLGFWLVELRIENLLNDGFYLLVILTPNGAMRLRHLTIECTPRPSLVKPLSLDYFCVETMLICIQFKRTCNLLPACMTSNVEVSSLYAVVFQFLKQFVSFQ